MLTERLLLFLFDSLRPINNLSVISLFHDRKLSKPKLYLFRRKSLSINNFTLGWFSFQSAFYLKSDGQTIHVKYQLWKEKLASDQLSYRRVNGAISMILLHNYLHDKQHWNKGHRLRVALINHFLAVVFSKFKSFGDFSLRYLSRLCKVIYVCSYN